MKNSNKLEKSKSCGAFQSSKIYHPRQIGNGWLQKCLEFFLPLSGHQSKATYSSSRLSSSKYYFSLFRLETGGTPDILSRLVISNRHNSHGCQWDFPKHLAYSRLSTTLAMLIIKGFPLGCLRSRCKTLSSYNEIKEVSSNEGIFLSCNFLLLMMSREQIRLFMLVMRPR